MERLIRLQSLLLSFSENYVADVTAYIKDTYGAPDNLMMLVFEILNLFEIRPNQIQNIIKLAKSIDEIDAFKAKFLKKLLKKAQYIHGPLIRELFDEGVYSLDQIKKVIEDCNELTIFFAPELEATSEMLAEFPQAREIVDSFEELSDDNWEMYKELISFGYVENTIGYGIKYDDSSLLSEYAIQGFDMHGNVNTCMHETIAGYEMSLINAAAFYGAVDCFNELLLNKIELKEDACEYAVYGGNEYIINKCREKFPTSPLLVRAAVRCSMNDLLVDLIGRSMRVELSAFDIIDVHNYFAFDFLLEKKCISLTPGDIQQATKFAELTENFDLYAFMRKTSSLPKLK